MAGDGHSNPTLLSPTPHGWSVAAIDDLCENVTSGGTPLRSNSRFYQGGNHSWFKTQELKDSVLFQSEERITDQALARTSAKLFPKDTVLMAMYGDGKTITSLGILAEEAATNQACCAMIPDRAVCEPKFLFYALKHHREDFIRIASGGAQRNLSGKLIRRFAINTPPLGEQSAIAHILGTLDDKIELNRRMNETLEAMARALFKSWFVDFDPVRAKAEGGDTGLPKPLADLFPDSLEDSELGEIPKGWRAGRLDDVLAELVSGARPKGGAVEEGVPSIGAENVISLGRYDFSKEKYVPQEFFERLKRNGAAVRAGDVLLYKDGAQIGRKTYFDCDFPHAAYAINEHVFILRPRRSEEQRFLFFWLDQASMTQEIVSLNSNSAQPGINQSGVRGLPVLLPKDEVVDAFDQLTVRLTTRLFANCKESLTLAALRDTLLPKLISGELRVKEALRIVQGTQAC